MDKIKKCAVAQTSRWSVSGAGQIHDLCHYIHTDLVPKSVPGSAGAMWAGCGGAFSDLQPWSILILGSSFLLQIF